jgi:hypothetical protein
MVVFLKLVLGFILESCMFLFEDLSSREFRDLGIEGFRN